MDKLSEFFHVAWSDMKSIALGFCLGLVVFVRGIPSTGPEPATPPAEPGPVLPHTADRVVSDVVPGGADVGGIDVPNRDSPPGEAKVYPSSQNFAPILPLD